MTFENCMANYVQCFSSFQYLFIQDSPFTQLAFIHLTSIRSADCRCIFKQNQLWKDDVLWWRVSQASKTVLSYEECGVLTSKTVVIRCKCNHCPVLIGTPSRCLLPSLPLPLVSAVLRVLCQGQGTFMWRITFILSLWFQHTVHRPTVVDIRSISPHNWS
jgi:hypothetical protein